VAFAAEYEAAPRRQWTASAVGVNGKTAIRLGHRRRDQGSRVVRPDGKTLVAQPHLRFEAKDMWTLEHVRDTSLAARPRIPGALADRA